jgi:ABC-2 type transport system ATP-binding protein
LLQLQQLSKKFGKKQVLNGVNLSVNAGEICALLGVNGAGKTTLMNIILDLLPADGGEVLFEGRPVIENIQEFRRQIGVVPSDDQLIDAFTARDFLHFSGSAYGLPLSEVKERAASLMQFFFEEDPGGKSMGTFSTGMKKKIALCAAVLHKPKLLLLDEPFAGLDPVVSVTVLEFLKQYAGAERAVLVSSHDLEYINRMATHIAVLHEGSIRFEGNLEAFTTQGRQEISEALFQILVPKDRDASTLNWLMQ